MAEPAVAQQVMESLHYRHSRVYTLHAFCVMPNHVHMLFTPLSDGESYHALPSILQSLKRYTARRSNELLGRRGRFWQEESYDHFVRNSDEHQRIVHYIRNNPVKAGLVTHADEWPWSYGA